MSAAQARTLALAISTALALAYLIIAPQTLDLAAQTYRADLWDSDGFVIWDPGWYNGFSVPGYSLLYPPLGALLGPVLLGAICAVLATALFAAIALRACGERAWLGVVVFGVASAAAPFAGRTTFALGLVLALACVLAVQRRRAFHAALAGLLAGFASPVAGLFAGLACAAVVLATLPLPWPATARGALGPDARLARTAALAGGVGAALALVLMIGAFPTSGYQPFDVSAWIWIPFAVLALLLIARPRAGAGREGAAALAPLRWGAILYLLIATAALLFETPLGGNVVRLGATLAAPLVAIVLLVDPPPRVPARRRTLLLVALLVPLTYWCWTATVRDIAASAGDPSVEEAYYEPVLGLIADNVARSSGGSTVTEPVRVAPSRNRWEAVHVAEQFPIDGGWLRQLEADELDFFDDGSLDEYEYRWRLADRGVSLVAVSDAEPDHLTGAEQEMFDAGTFDEELVGEAGEWRLYRINGPESYVLRGDAKLTDLGPDYFGVTLGDEGEALMALSYSPYFEVAEGEGCVERAVPPSGSRDITRVSGAPGTTIEVEASLSLAGAFGRDSDCVG